MQLGQLTPKRCRALAWAQRATCAGLLAALLIFEPSGSQLAFAAGTEDLDQLIAEVEDAASKHATALQRSDKLQQQVNELADEILHLEQDIMPVKRGRAGKAAAALYKMHESSANLLCMLFGSDDWGDLLDITKYLSRIQDHHVKDLEALKTTRSELIDKLAQITAAKDEAIAEFEHARDALASAQDAQQKVRERAAHAPQQEAERAAEAAAQTEATVAQLKNRHEAAAEARQITPERVSETEHAPARPAQPDPTPTPETQPQERPAEAESGGWKTGLASHYGTGDGFMGGTTANGETVTETSMGIAMLDVPFGTRVEISYRGRSVIAYVNDRGPYVHGRVIDMQPAVARALGMIEAGVGTVSYRFL
ncbi:hypothetical protein K6V98_06215 [Collinsella sp. AGMB00827]|uniref:RlpA-like protein double-psi beta-barrel domain-containing protein n=1 Tax=Collinsella ureilytica TaxID=2869515 RepID=A0ABS7MKP2_9ACTN|nr:RlpA-like double-psi beta-barrel domain-containing protein [Collinsella urealyticum]MBY4797939.1 hypothetical protein [Collinsella urealyticum]